MFVMTFFFNNRSDVVMQWLDKNKLWARKKKDPRKTKQTNFNELKKAVFFVLFFLRNKCNLKKKGRDKKL